MNELFAFPLLIRLWSKAKIPSYPGAHAICQTEFKLRVNLKRPRVGLTSRWKINPHNSSPLKFLHSQLIPQGGLFIPRKLSPAAAVRGRFSDRRFTSGKTIDSRRDFSKNVPKHG